MNDTQQRFTIQKASGMYLHLPIFDNDVELADGDVCILLNEQQSTIRKLQDLCGESDSENAKLRLKNKELQEELKLLKPTNIEQYEQIVQLQEENEQLKKSEKINMEYAEQIFEENHKLRIAKNDLRIENEQLKNRLNKDL